MVTRDLLGFRKLLEHCAWSPPEGVVMVAEVLPEIDPAICNGCGDCVTACKPAALAMADGKAVLAHPDRCQYDGACEPICPVGAIQLPYVVVLAS